MKDLKVTMKQNITAVKAVAILKKNGLILTEKEAQEVLDFLYKMAKLDVKEVLKK